MRVAAVCLPIARARGPAMLTSTFSPQTMFNWIPRWRQEPKKREPKSVIRTHNVDFNEWLYGDPIRQEAERAKHQEEAKHFYKKNQNTKLGGYYPHHNKPDTAHIQLDGSTTGLFQNIQEAQANVGPDSPVQPSSFIFIGSLQSLAHHKQQCALLDHSGYASYFSPCYAGHIHGASRDRKYEGDYIFRKSRLNSPSHVMLLFLCFYSSIP